MEKQKLTRVEFLNRMAQKGITYDFILELLKEIGISYGEDDTNEFEFSAQGISCTMERSEPGCRCGGCTEWYTETTLWEQIVKQFCQQNGIDIPKEEK